MIWEVKRCQKPGVTLATYWHATQLNRMYVYLFLTTSGNILRSLQYIMYLRCKIQIFWQYNYNVDWIESARLSPKRL